MKILLRSLLVIVFVILSTRSVFAQTFPQPSGYVNDFAQIYSPSFRSQLEQELQTFDASTSAEISVVTVPDLQDTQIDDYAVRLFEKWKIGKAKKDNGILLLIAKQEREVRIEVGYGLEGVINDARAGRIIRDVITPEFKQGDYESGTQLAVTTMMHYVRGEAVTEAVPEKKSDWSGLIDFIPFLFFGVIYLGSFLARTKDFYLGGILGGIVGIIVGILVGQILITVLSVLFLSMLGLGLDFLLSRNYERLKAQNKSTDWWGSRGGFYGGGGSSSGGGFGGFGGGSSGGGGASGHW